jgi:hypothetical protein
MEIVFAVGTATGASTTTAMVRGLESVAFLEYNSKRRAHKKQSFDEASSFPPPLPPATNNDRSVYQPTGPPPGASAILVARRGWRGARRTARLRRRRTIHV